MYVTRYHQKVISHIHRENICKAYDEQKISIKNKQVLERNKERNQQKNGQKDSTFMKKKLKMANNMSQDT